MWLTLPLPGARAYLLRVGPYPDTNTALSAALAVYTRLQVPVHVYNDNGAAAGTGLMVPPAWRFVDGYNPESFAQGGRSILAYRAYEDPQPDPLPVGYAGPGTADNYQILRVDLPADESPLSQVTIGVYDSERGDGSDDLPAYPTPDEVTAGEAPIWLFAFLAPGDDPAAAVYEAPAASQIKAAWRDVAGRQVYAVDKDDESALVRSVPVPLPHPPIVLDCSWRSVARVPYPSDGPPGYRDVGTLQFSVRLAPGVSWQADGGTAQAVSLTMRGDAPGVALATTPPNYVSPAGFFPAAGEDAAVLAWEGPGQGTVTLAVRYTLGDMIGYETLGFDLLAQLRYSDGSSVSDFCFSGPAPEGAPAPAPAQSRARAASPCLAPAPGWQSSGDYVVRLDEFHELRLTAFAPFNNPTPGSNRQSPLPRLHAELVTQEPSTPGLDAFLGGPCFRVGVGLDVGSKGRLQIGPYIGFGRGVLPVPL